MEQKRQIIRQKLEEKYEKVVDLYRQGMKIRAIARRLGLHRTTVLKFVRAGEFPEMAQRRKAPTKLDPYLSYLEERWQAGCRNRLQPCEKYANEVLMALISWSTYGQSRKATRKKVYLNNLRSHPQPTRHPTVRTRSWAASRAAWLLVLEKNDLKQEEALALDWMTQAEPQVETAMKSAQEFLDILRTRQAKILPD